jgi:hypothetical protein
MHLWLQSDPTLNRNVLNTATQVNQQVELAAFLLYHLQFSRSTEIKGPAAHALVGMQLCLRKKELRTSMHNQARRLWLNTP